MGQLDKDRSSVHARVPSRLDRVVDTVEGYSRKVTGRPIGIREATGMKRKFTAEAGVGASVNMGRRKRRTTFPSPE